MLISRESNNLAKRYILPSVTELGSDLVQLRQEHDRLCLALLQGIEPDDSGCRIVNDNLVSRAMEMALSYQQKQ